MLTASQSKNARIASWILQIAVAAIFIVTGALPKLTGDPLSIALFEKLGFPPGRFVVGAIEAVVVVLILVPRTASIGALLAVGTMLGAVASHLGPLGISTELMVDGETIRNAGLFPMAVITLLLSGIALLLLRDEVPVVGPRLAPRGRVKPAGA
jgi:uncharacterized membrane protein YphA (DoxX/SURF4 family)